MQLRNLMPFTKTIWSAWEGADSKDVKAFRDVTWPKLKLKMKIWHIALTYLEVSLGTYYWEVCHASKKNLKCLVVF